MKMIKKIGVLMGGTSNERNVSLDSGKNVTEALSSLGKYDVIPIDIKENNLDALPEDVDAVYIALHGGWGENGGVQNALNAKKIPYTGPGAQTSRIAMDKIKTKMVLELKNVPTPPWGLSSAGDEKPPLPVPLVVKPPSDGSSFGISKVSDLADWPKALENAFAAMENASLGVSEKVALVEEFIPGREFTVAVVDGEPWPVVEIVAQNGWYGFDEKYVSNETRYPFLEDDELSKKLKQTAVDAYNALECRGVTRVDLRVSPLGRIYVLELNTSPGLTSHSLVPKAGMKTGLTFAEVCDRILSCAATD
jgi:D-alanine-D-alanine ligase